MRTHHDESRPAIRPAWVSAVISASQRFARHCESIEPDEVHELLTEFSRGLPAPVGPLERLTLRALLLDVALRCGGIIHAWADRRRPHRCGFLPAAIIERCWTGQRGDPQRAFLAWVDTFSAELVRTHPPSPAGRVARHIRQHYDRPLDLEGLARRVHVTPSQLRRSFQREFGRSARDYQRTQRLIAAIEHLPNGKIEAIALQVGYRSKKNFYRALQQMTGLTPTAIRRLPRERARHLIESLGGGAARTREQHTAR